MKRKKQIVTAVILSGSLGLGTQSLFAQATPGGGPNPGQPTGPSVPQPGPTIPGRPAPGLPQTQTDPIPGQPGTIPEKAQRPDAGSQSGMPGVSSDNIKKTQEALKAKGFNPGSVSGTMDAKTQQALRDFQKANNLPVTGALDPKTAEKLGVRLNGEERLTPQPGQGSTAPKSDSPAR